MEGKKKQRKLRFSPAMAVSIVALFTALTGAATALPGTDSVNSRDIIDQAVKAKDLNTGSVQADEIGDGITPHTAQVVVDGGVNQNGAYTVEDVTARRRAEIAAIVERLAPPQRAALVGALTAFNEAGGEPPAAEPQPYPLGWAVDGGP